MSEDAAYISYCKRSPYAGLGRSAVNLYGQGYSIRQIAERYNMTFGSVRTMLIRSGVSLRPPGGQKKRNP